MNSSFYIERQGHHLPQPALSGHLHMSLDDPREEIQDEDVSIGHDDLVILQRHNQVTSSD